MSHEAFQQAIFSEPDDDAVRLIYADWLDENGEPIWAEFIRAQCELATMTPASDQYVSLKEREEELEMLLPEDSALTSYLDHNLDELDLASAYRHSYRRGFLSTCTIEAFEPEELTESQLHQLCDRLDTIIAQSAIQGLDFDGFPATHFTTILQRDLMKSARELTVQFWDNFLDEEDTWTDYAEVIANCPNLSQVFKLKLDTPLAGDGLRALAFSPHLKKVKELELTPTDVSPEGFGEFARSPLAKQLGSFICGYTGLSSGHLEGLTREVWPLLHSLVMDWNLDQQAIQVLARSSSFPNLASFRLRSSQLEFHDVELLCQNESWQLRSLDLAYCDLRSRDARLLAQSPVVKQLHTLCLASNNIGSQGLAALARSQHLTQLRRLDLSFNSLSASKLQALMRGDALQNLTSLDLNHGGEGSSATEGTALMKVLELPRIRHLALAAIPLGARGMQALAKKEWFQNIRVLNLTSCRIGKSGAEALLEAVDPAQLVRLYLYDNKIPPRLRDRFREQLGSERVIIE